MFRFLWRWVKNKNGLYDVTIDIKQDENSDCVYGNYIPVTKEEDDE